MSFDPEILRVARITQDRHAFLIGQLNQRRSTEARLETLDLLRELQRDHWEASNSVLGVAFPIALRDDNPDHLLVKVVRNDIADTIRRAQVLDEQRSLQKTIRAITEIQSTVPELPKGNGGGGFNLTMLLVGLAGASLLIAIFGRK